MKNLLYVLVALIAWVWSTYLMKWEWLFVKADQDIFTLVRSVATDYRAEQNFDTACFAWGEQVSLGAMIYAIILQEWWHKPGTVWYNTNNRGSLHKNMWLKNIKWYVTADSSTTRPIYNSVYDGLYEKAYLITTSRLYNSCNFWYAQLFSYIVWPNADPNKIHPNSPSHRQCRTNECFVRYKLWNLVTNAKKYDVEILWVPASDVDHSTDTIQPTTHDAAPQENKSPKRDHKSCYYVDTIRKADFVQFDMDGELLDFKHIGMQSWKEIDVFNCYWEMY